MVQSLPLYTENTWTFAWLIVYFTQVALNNEIRKFHDLCLDSM